MRSTSTTRRSNEPADLLTQMEAKVLAIAAQADALRDETEAQLASATNG